MNIKIGSVVMVNGVRAEKFIPHKEDIGSVWVVTGTYTQGYTVHNGAYGKALFATELTLLQA